MLTGRREQQSKASERTPWSASLLQQQQQHCLSSHCKQTLTLSCWFAIPIEVNLWASMESTGCCYLTAHHPGTPLLLAHLREMLSPELWVPVCVFAQMDCSNSRKESTLASVSNLLAFIVYLGKLLPSSELTDCGDLWIIEVIFGAFHFLTLIFYNDFLLLSPLDVTEGASLLLWRRYFYLWLCKQKHQCVNWLAKEKSWNEYAQIVEKKCAKIKMKMKHYVQLDKNRVYLKGTVNK